MQINNDKWSPKRGWIWILLAIVIGGIVWWNRAEALEVVHTLQKGHPVWIAVAVAFQFLFFVLYAALYQTSFGAVDVPAQTRRCLPLWFASVFVNTVAPPLGFTVFIDDAIRRGYSGAKATVGVGVVRATDVLTFGLLLLVGFGALFLHHALRPFHLIAAGILLAVILGWFVVVLLALRYPETLHRALQGIENILRKTPFGKKIASDWSSRTANDLIGGLRPLFSQPARLYLPFFVAMAAHIVDIAGLAALFPAFHQAVSLDVLLAGFGVGVLFWMVSLTPEGVGTVEGMMALTFVAQGVPPHHATAIALAFRGLTYYLPLVLGLFFVRSLTRPSQASATDSKTLIAN